jgi:hypothetical protein
MSPELFGKLKAGYESFILGHVVGGFEVEFEGVLIDRFIGGD